jgi:hypothetical protein
MIDAIWDWVKFNFWFSLLFLAIGLAVMVPLLLTKPFRKRLLRSNWDVEVVGVVVFIIALIVISIYNNMGAGGV